MTKELYERIPNEWPPGIVGYYATADAPSGIKWLQGHWRFASAQIKSLRFIESKLTGPNERAILADLRRAHILYLIGEGPLPSWSVLDRLIP